MFGVVVLGLGILLAAVGPVRLFALARIRAKSRANVVFTIANRSQFTDPLSLATAGTALGEHAAIFTSEPAVTADAAGITFWDNSPPLDVGSIPWGRIAAIEVGDVRSRYRRLTPYAITLVVASGSALIPVPLLSPNAQRSPFAARWDVARIAHELRGLWLAAAPNDAA